MEISELESELKMRKDDVLSDTEERYDGKPYHFEMNKISNS